MGLKNGSTERGITRMSKLACHGWNFKKGAVGGIDMHNRRLGKTHSNDEIDTERTHLNMTYKDTNNLYQDCKEEVELVKANGGRLRSDQNWITEFITYAPKEEMSYEEYQRYFQEVYNYFSDKIGEQNIKLAVVHMDEKTPHMHLDFMPIIRNEQGKPARLSSKELMTRKFLTDIQNELPKRLAEKGFDVQRGDKVKVEDKHLKGRSVRSYKSDMEKKKEELLTEVKQLEWSVDAIRDYDLRYLQEDVAEKEAELADLSKKIEEANKSLDYSEKHLKMANTAFQNVLKQLEECEKDYDAIRKGIHASKEISELLPYVRDLAAVLKDEQSLQIVENTQQKTVHLSDLISKADHSYKKHQQSPINNRQIRTDFDDR